MWDNYGVYVCNLATSGGEATYIFNKLPESNPQYKDMLLLGKQLQKLLPIETPTGGKILLWIKLDELNAGMDIDKVVKLLDANLAE